MRKSRQYFSQHRAIIVATALEDFRGRNAHLLRDFFNDILHCPAVFSTCCELKPLCRILLQGCFYKRRISDDPTSEILSIRYFIIAFSHNVNKIAGVGSAGPILQICAVFLIGNPGIIAKTPQNSPNILKCATPPAYQNRMPAPINDNDSSSIPMHSIHTRFF